MFKQIIEWPFQSHLVVVVDSATTFFLRKTGIRISGILVINAGSQMLVDCKFDIDVSG